MIDMDQFDGEMRLANVNVRSERHGEVDTPAVDLKMEWVVSNEILAAFHPRMRSAFYEKDGQPALDGVPEAMAAVIFPDLDPLKVHAKETGLMVRVVHGLSGSSDLVLKDCEVSGFKLDLLPGGSVEVTFTVSTTDIDEKRLGKLGLMLKGRLPVRIERQDPPEGMPTDDEGAGRKKGKSPALA